MVGPVAPVVANLGWRRDTPLPTKVGIYRSSGVLVLRVVNPGADSPADVLQPRQLVDH